ENFLLELGLKDEILPALASAHNNLVLKKGKLIPLPRSIFSFIKTPLLSSRAKLRLLKEPFIPRSSKYESVAEFTKRRLGQEVLDSMVNPFVSGIHAGDPRRLSLEHAFPSLYAIESTYGSLLKGFFKKKGKNSFKPKIISFKGGMQRLPLRIAEILGEALHLNAQLISIKKENAQWHLKVNTRAGTLEKAFDKLIISTPVHSWKNLPLETPIQKEFTPLAQIEYAPITTLSLGFKANQIKEPLNSFGFLVPEIEDEPILGTLFSSSTFSQRAPAGYVSLTTFLGGMRQPGLAKKTQKETQALVLQALEKLLGLSGPPVWAHFKSWEKGIPQYTLGFEKFLDALAQIEANQPGLHFLGNFRGGTSLAKCIENALNIDTTINL
ncbi:MAG: protoporphyrinogen oxidase, partial [Bdellovibrionota bacterium]